MGEVKKKPRNRDLAKIHIAKKQLCLSDEDYRQMLWTVARVRSSGDLDSHGRKVVLEHLVSRGFKSAQSGRPVPAGSRAPMLGKIHAMLADAGKPIAYGDALAKRIAKSDRLEWCAPEGLRKVIAALVYDQKRHAKSKQETADG